jgi:hypothetical protein
MKERLYSAILEAGKVRCAIVEAEVLPQAEDTATQRFYAWNRLFMRGGKEADIEHPDGVAHCTPEAPCEECHARAASWWRQVDVYAAYVDARREE